MPGYLTHKSLCMVLALPGDVEADTKKCLEISPYIASYTLYS